MSIAEKLTTIAENEQKVYKVGYESGKVAGQQTEYDRFWDAYQENGNLADYGGVFYGAGWNDNTFKPKYDIKPTIASNIFRACGYTGNIETLFNELGIAFDTSACTTFDYGCYQSKCKAFPKFDFTSAARVTSVFGYCQAEEIKIRVSGAQSYSGVFTGCYKLVKLTVDGEIGQNGFDVQWSYSLDKGSLTSIINALSKTTSGLTVTFNKLAVNNAFETSKGAADGSTSQEWLNLIATKSNWKISLV